MHQSRKDSLGLHLFNRESGLNILVDEIAYHPDQWSVAPRHISMALTNECNLACAHCYAPKGAANLTAGEVLAWAGELSDQGCLGIGLGGGEPTLHPDLGAICASVMRHTRLAITITTNALLFDSHLSHNLAGNVNFIRVSMGGVDNTYEQLHGKSDLPPEN